jgi:hypothetical protein
MGVKCIENEMDEWEMDGDCHGLGLLFRPTLAAEQPAPQHLVLDRRLR